MKFIKNVSESEMILEFLKGEFKSNRFNTDLLKALNQLNLNETIIINGNITNQKENEDRLKIINLFRGYPNKELFENFPKIKEWKFMQLSSKDIYSIYYINYDYWNELSNGTSSPIEAVKNIKNRIEIFNVSNKPFLEGIKYINEFPPVILITCNDKKYLIIEGHSRMTIYGFDPEKLNGTYAYIGYCSFEEMKKYDIRMI